MTMIDRAKERVTSPGVHFLSAGKDKHRAGGRWRENKESRGRENKYVSPDGEECPCVFSWALMAAH